MPYLFFMSKYTKAHAEYYREYSRKYRETHKEQVRQYQAAYRNYQKILKSAEPSKIVYKKNGEKMTEGQLNYLKTLNKKFMEEYNVAVFNKLNEIETLRK